MSNNSSISTEFKQGCCLFIVCIFLTVLFVAMVVSDDNNKSKPVMVENIAPINTQYKVFSIDVAATGPYVKSEIEKWSNENPNLKIVSISVLERINPACLVIVAEKKDN